MPLSPPSPPHTYTRVPVDNELDAAAITALVPGLKTLKGLQILNLEGACVGTRGLSVRVTRAVFDSG